MDGRTEKIQPIWISSIEHMMQFNRITKEAPMWRKLLGAFKIPSGFPYVRVFFGVFPVVYFAEGSLSVEDGVIFYDSCLPKSFTSKYANLKGDLSFQLPLRDIKSIEWYRHPDSFNEYYNISWIRILTDNNSIMGGDFLLCVGDLNTEMDKIILGTNWLYDMLIQSGSLQEM